MLISTLATYDMEKYDIIGPVSGLSVHAISFFRNIVADITSLFGGAQSTIKEKFLDVRREAVQDMVEKAKANKADMIAGLDLEVTEMANNFVVCVATGTALKEKNKSQKQRTQKVRN
jgi:uncharacterized protein YbjQ (UPF0145 family)